VYKYRYKILILNLFLLTGGPGPGGPTTTRGLVPPGAGVLGDDFFTDTPGSPVDEDEFPGGTARGGGGSTGGLGHGSYTDSYTNSYTLYLYMVMDMDTEPMTREGGAEPYFRGFETKKKSPLTESNRRHLDDRDVYPNSYSPMRGRVEKPIYQLS